MKKETTAPQLDLKAFAQSAGHIEGHDLLSNYQRLLEDTQGQGADRLLNWSARGELRTNEAGLDQIWLHLSADVSLPLTCQRCLAPADIDVTVNRSFRFVESEELAEEQDDEAQEDVLAISREFKLAELIEDEVLMEIPLVPRHDACPGDVKLAVADAGFDDALSLKRNPFEVLAKLKK
jgi:uncharacterized protein